MVPTLMYMQASCHLCSLLLLCIQHLPKEYEEDAKHVIMLVCEEPTFDGCWKMLEVSQIPLAVNKMLAHLLLPPDKSQNPDDDTSFVTAVLLQWLVTYLCKKLIQLMTPEALLNNHKKIPSHYISAYLNHQNHFSLKEVVRKYQSCLEPHIQDVTRYFNAFKHYYTCHEYLRDYFTHFQCYLLSV